MTSEARQRFEADNESRRERVIRMLPSEHHATYHALMEHVASGLHHSEMLARSLSPAQLRLINALRKVEGSAVLSRSVARRYDLVGTTVAASIPTVRALIARGLLQWMRQEDEEIVGLADCGFALIRHLNART